MVSYEYRNIAKSVASGCPVSELDVDIYGRDGNKAYTYGLVAKTLSRLAIPRVDEFIGERKPEYVSTVTGLLGRELHTRVCEVIEQDDDLRAELDDATDRRFSMVHGNINDITDSGLANMRAGVNTAIDIETTTLATIQRLTNRGQTITREGLRKSQRVPFAYAMQSLANFNPADGRLVERTYLTGVGNTSGEVSEIVFLPDAVELSPTKGLYLTKGIPTYAGYSRFAGEATVTCPATMVKNFIYDLHAVAADACVEAGIIPVVDNKVDILT